MPFSYNPPPMLDDPPIPPEDVRCDFLAEEGVKVEIKGTFVHVRATTPEPGSCTRSSSVPLSPLARDTPSAHRSMPQVHCQTTPPQRWSLKGSEPSPCGDTTPSTLCSTNHSPVLLHQQQAGPMYVPNMPLPMTAMGMLPPACYAPPYERKNGYYAPLVQNVQPYGWDAGYNRYVDPHASNDRFSAGAGFGTFEVLGVREEPATKARRRRKANKKDQQASSEQKVFVGGLSQTTDNAALKKHFEQWGPVKQATVLVDSHSKRSRGFGFVEFEDGFDHGAIHGTHMIEGAECGVRGYLPDAEGQRPQA